MKNWHALPWSDVTDFLKVRPETGLSEAEATRRLEEYGPNELRERGGRTPLLILWEQVSATMVLILIAAALASLFLGKLQEAISILAIVVLFVLLGFIQEFRAEKAMAALKKMSVPNVRVRRDGIVQTISSREIVPGDLLLLEAGNIVPADARIVESASLRVQEAALTGESEPVTKFADLAIAENAGLGDRTTMVYLGTNVNFGRGVAVVTGTGMETELGKIANLIQDVKSQSTPLQKRLNSVGTTLAIIGVVIALAIGVFGIIAGESVADMFLTGVSVAVAIVPEGLPAVLTITLALGARRMLARNALIRKLPAVETLGSVTVICSDKTGTLTLNRMTVTAIETLGADSYGQEHCIAAVRTDANLGLIAAVSSLCTDVAYDPNNPHAEAVGDPTELALVEIANKGGLYKHDLEQAFPRIGELSFDSDRKRMTTIHSKWKLHPLADERVTGLINGIMGNASALAITKGSVDGLLAVSNWLWDGTKSLPMDTALRSKVLAANDDLARRGIRVLGVGVRALDSFAGEFSEADERDIIFLGLVGMIDPPRPEVRDAVSTCQSAGIRTIMITGDHPLTAVNIAQQLGITDNTKAVTGSQIAAMTETELNAALVDTNVFARVSPEHKLRIVNALQVLGNVAAMTGDGVNDAPALKKANIGVAMGITGTDVSKEAADMVLVDDNFATIVASVEEGRVIYSNIRKFIKFSIAGNLAKVLAMTAAPLAASFFLTPEGFAPLTIALLPLQLLWLNLLTDGLLGIGLGVEPAERGTMQRPPIRPNSSVFSDGVGGQILRLGTFMGIISSAVGVYFWSVGVAEWQTMMFSTLAFCQMFQALGIRSGDEPLLRAGLMTNKPLLGLVVLTFILQMSVIYIPVLNTFFKTTPLSAWQIIWPVALSSLVYLAAELDKVLFPSTKRA